MVMRESHVARLGIAPEAAKMGESLDISFLDNIFSFAVISHYAASDPVKLAIVPLHDGAKRRLITGERPPNELGIARRAGNLRCRR